MAPSVARSRASPHPRGRPRGSPGLPLCPPRPRPAPPMSSLDSESSGFRLLCAVYIERHGEDFEHRRKKKTASPPGLRNYLFCYNQYFRLRPSRMEASKTGLKKGNSEGDVGYAREPARVSGCASAARPAPRLLHSPPHPDVAHVLTPPGKPPGRAPAASRGRRGPGGRTGRGPAEA